MKKLFIYFLFIAFNQAFIHAQSVFPTYQDKPVWQVSELGWHNRPDIMYHIVIHEDTTLCGKNYNPAVAIDYPRSGDTTVLGYYRQEGQRVYFRLYEEACDSFEEYPIYDFSLQVGDNLYIGHDITAVILGIRYETYCGITRKALDIRYIGEGQLHRGFGKWMEGIGEIQNPFMTPFRVGGGFYDASSIVVAETKQGVLFSLSGAECPDTVDTPVFPTYEDKPVWCMTKFGLLLPESNYTIELEPDTMLCGYTYNPVMVTNELLYGGSTFTGRIGYTRTEGRKVFFRNQTCDTPEVLVCDFSLEEGDTIRHTQEENTIFGIIAKTDSILYKGIFRKTLIVNYPLFRDPLPTLTAQRIWVEGIGNTHHPFDIVDCLFGSCEYETGLMCFSSNDGILYGSCTEACGIDSVQQDNNVFPTYEDKPVWCVEESIFGRPYETYRIELKADTFICGKTYTPVWVQNQPQFGGEPRSGVIGYIRQEGQQVYETFDNCLSEYLLYDFSLQEGDTFYYSQQYKSEFGIISKIDTIEYEGVFRKTMTVDYPQLFPFPRLPIQRIWIEGIGDTFHPFNSVGCLAGNCEFNARLICFSDNDGILYGSCTEACGIISNLEESPTLGKYLKLFPNPIPVNGEVRLTNHYKDDISLQVSNALGQVLYTIQLQKQVGENITLNWSPPAPGIYWILMNTKDGKQDSIKLIAQ